MLPETFLAAQNPDGGWPYRSGSSWTEPTVYALLALSRDSDDGVLGSRGRALSWLNHQQRPDGGWAPQPRVEQSTWVTSLVLLLPSDWIAAPRLNRAAGWLLAQTGEESTLVHRLRQMLLGNQVSSAGDQGWPWFPGTAAWVSPTAVAMLALRRFERRQQLLKQAGGPGGDVARRLAMGREFLLSHMCADGGWNHGSARALGYEGNSYPETTGLALLALAGTDPRPLAKSLARAERHLQECRSAEGASWLRMGLLAHGRRPAAPPAEARTLRDAALLLLADNATQGSNVFL